MHLIQTRAYLPFGTFSKLEVGNHTFYTVERPWKNNRSNISCIPEGTYKLKKRLSGVVQRTSKFMRGWEVTDVVGRTYIMMHVANWPTNVNGCIGIGEEIRSIGNKLGVTNSRESFTKFMRLLADEKEHTLTIKSGMVL